MNSNQLPVISQPITDHRSPITLSLNGCWQFKGFLDEDWRRREAHLPDCADPRRWYEGEVPGSMQDDLWQNGLIPDPYFEKNSELIEWVPQRTWVYRRTFTVDETLRGQQVRLRLAGVDFTAQFFLNGARLGEHTSMFIPAEFDVTYRLHFDKPNTLVVVLSPAPVEQSMFGRTSQVRTYKTRINYGWDVNPRLVHLGIWQPVSLIFTGPARIEDVWVRPLLHDGFNQATMQVQTTLFSEEATPAALHLSLYDDNGRLAAEHHTPINLDAGRSVRTHTLTIDQPDLWWPNGAGEQPLYRAKVQILVAGSLSDERLETFGIRRLEWVQNETPDERALPYTLVVNGRKLYLKGWNWTPLDLLYGVPRPAKLERLLILAQRAHVNILRAWGGGLLETPDFYNLCDQLGILVWQEFPLSCSVGDRKPPTDPDYIALCTTEVETAVRLRRNHPSLALWCGGNELESLDLLPLPPDEPVLAAQGEVVARLDPDRRYQHTSASGPLPFNGINDSRNRPQDLHDVHGPWHYQGLTKQYELANAAANLLHSEFGGEGLTNIRAIEAMMSQDNRWPASRDNPVWYHLGASVWVDEHLWRDIWGELPDLATAVRASQFIQAEAVQTLIDANRRRKFRNSGSLPWRFNESYPVAACTSAVDYFAQPKPLYYTVANAYAPLRLMAQYPALAWTGRDQFETVIWAANSHEVAFSGAELTVSLRGMNGRSYVSRTSTVTIQPNQAMQLAVFTHPLRDMREETFLLDLQLKAGANTVRNRYLFSKGRTLRPWLELPKTNLSVSGDGSQVTVTNVGDVVALFVWLEDGRSLDADGYVYFDDNYFHLLPGEVRRVTAMWTDKGEGERVTAVSAWNVNTITVKSKP